MNKGNYYKKKTKDWLVKEGYTCEYLEKLQRIFIPPKKGEKLEKKKQFSKRTGKLLYVKRDLFASDILAMKRDKVIFVQVKSGGKGTGINIKGAIEEFNKYPFPNFIDRWIVIWKDKEKEPEIVDIKEVQ